MWIILSIETFILGFLFGFLVFFRRNLKYKMYWKKMREEEGRYQITRKVADIQHLSTDSIMNNIEQKVNWEIKR